MRCEQARKHMSLMLDEVLTQEQRMELEQHLRECVGCRAEWRLLKTVQHAMTTTVPAPLPYDLVPVVMERVRAIEREKLPRRLWLPLAGRWRWLALAAAPVLLTLAFLATHLWQSSSATATPPPSVYWSAHATNAAVVTIAPETAPISLALSSLPYAGDE